METSEQIKKETDPIYQKVSKVIPEVEWAFHAPLIHKINVLKKQKNAVILAHNYQTPEIFHGVADIAADSLALAVEAEKTNADIIILCGVHFMAETAKLMNPSKKVLLPDMGAGCSLASSITGKDVRMLKEKYPGVPVVTYVNTSAEVKAESDVCCTSANAVKVVESLGTNKVIFLPDQYMAKYVQSKTKVQILKNLVDKIANEIQKKHSTKIKYFVGTMIELPRAAIRAKDIAKYADFFSFGTNDLTQTTFGISRDDSGKFLNDYVENKIFNKDPFVSIDERGVGELIKIATERGRLEKKALKLGICGEHGGDPASIEFCEKAKLNYVSCSPYRVPIARLAAAQAYLKKKK